MSKEQNKQSFGDTLRLFRGQTVDRGTGRPLSQDRFAYQISENIGLTITRNKVNNWENAKSSPHPQLDRDLLIEIVVVLHKFRGIKTLDDANHLLETGNYRVLTNEEVAQINREWVPSGIAQEGNVHSDEKSSIPTAIFPGLSGISSVRLNIEASEPLPVSLHVSKSGPGSVPPLPSLIVGRDEDLSNLKENLGITGKPKTSIQILTAIKGWPGVGKTTIASALAHDPDIQKTFPDGVLWVSLGPEPNLLSEIAAWGRALGTDELLHARTLEEAQTQLAALLRNRRMLLIIDDVWQPEHAMPFKVGGTNCAVVITTRRDDVANALAPAAKNIYRLKVLKDEDALTLLKELAPMVVEKHPKESLVLVQELEGLPLALQVAGRLLNTELNRGFGVIELISELRQGAKLLEAQAPVDRVELAKETTPTIAALLQTSLDLLDDLTRDYYAYLGVFAPRPATFDMEAMKFVWQMEDPKPVIKTLVDRGLLEFVPELSRYQMHALLVMLAKTLLTDDESENDKR